MMFSVPQFIDIEDKIAGPLTWRQLLWLIGMGAVILVVFSLFDTTVVLIFVALAFYKPGGFPMTAFIGNAFFFFFRPKIAVWERPTVPFISAKAPVHMHAVSEEKQGNKELTREKMAELARMIDQRWETKQDTG